jgi:putative PIN family toxin of toxin-antitoxin system
MIADTQTRQANHIHPSTFDHSRDLVQFMQDGMLERNYTVEEARTLYMKTQRKRLVFDASALVPVFLHPQGEEALLFSVAALDHNLYASPDVLQDVWSAIEHPENAGWQSAFHLRQWFELYERVVSIHQPSEKMRVCQNDADNHALALAVSVDADYLITKSHALLELQPSHRVGIIQVQNFRWKM